MKTIEEKAKAYDEAIKRGLDYIRHTPATEMVTRQDIFEAIFPELKESEDEKIRKELIENFKWFCGDYPETTKWGKDDNLLVKDIIAWLEKQGEKVTNINGEDYGIDGLYHAIKILERTIGRVTGYQSDDGILEHKAAINAVKELYEKQSENKPADKTTPKFKVGDWCIDKQDGTIFRIEKVMENTYRYKTCKGNSYSCTHGSLELDSRLWTIEDAKDGDVLVLETDEVEWIFIYREIVPAASEVPHDLLRYYFLLEGNYFNWSGVCAMVTEDYEEYLKPATKEQRDLLFQKMEEAGYEWDSEKKELKKIEPKILDINKLFNIHM